MPEKTWRQRFDKAVKRDGRSLRAISKASGLAETALWEMLNTEKEPGIGKLLAICEELKVSTSYILEGIERSPETERLMKAFARMSKDQQEAFLDFLERQRTR